MFSEARCPCSWNCIGSCATGVCPSWSRRSAEGDGMTVLASFPNQESLNMGHRDSARERFLRLLYKDIHICINPGDTPSEWWFVQPRNNSGLSASWHGLVPIQQQGGAWVCELPTIDVETLPWMIWMQILFQTGNHGGFPHVNVYPRDPSYHQVISYR